MDVPIRVLAAAASLWWVTALPGEIRLPAVISDHMVLQSGKPVAIWGWATPGEKIRVSFAGESVETEAAPDHRWEVKLRPLPPSHDAASLTVRGTNTIVIDDVLVGEVWHCAGQSNMAMQVKGLHGQIDNADAEIATARFPEIRMFAYQEIYSIYTQLNPPAQPLSDREGAWIVCSPETVAQFTALGYLFARDLQREIGVPIGLLNSAVGGTPIEAWTSLAAQEAQPAVHPVLADWHKRLDGYDPVAEEQNYLAAKLEWTRRRDSARGMAAEIPKSPAAFKNLRVSTPGGLFNGMISPLVPYGVRGVLWYQGERNAAGPLTHYYGFQLETLIRDWRARWSDDFYFAWVQIPRFQKVQTAPVEPKGWGVAVRDEMRRTLHVPNTGMAVTIDYGGVTDGHPTNKLDYAQRLLRLVLHDVYQRPVTHWSGPLYRSAKIEGDRIVISFEHGQGLRSAGGELKGFAIAGDDRNFVWAHARIDGDAVVVWSDSVQNPVAVRYAWAANPLCNLVNGGGLPASPFRTDDWR